MNEFRTTDNAPSCYLDHATTAKPKAPGVAEAMTKSLMNICASPGRSSHHLGREASALIEDVRLLTAKVFHVQMPERIIFTSGATMSLNMAIKGVVLPGDHVVATCFDHNSVLRPLVTLKQKGCKITIVRTHKPDNNFVNAVIREFRPNTRLVIINHVSNVSGVHLPIKEIGSIAQSQGIIVLLDAAQSAGHIPIDLSTLPVDLLALSGHKGLLGPPGVGCLIVNNPNLMLTPLLEGGTGYQSDALSPKISYPASFEVGTQNTPAIAGLGAALEFIISNEFDYKKRELNCLWKESLTKLSKMSHVHIHGYPSLQSIPIILFTVDGILPERVAHILDDKFNIQTRAGLHCAPLAHEALGTLRGAVRVAFGYGNSNESVTRLCNALDTLRP